MRGAIINQRLARILIIDDDALIRSSLSTALHSLGIEVVGTGATAREALNLVTEHKPDVALLDMDLGVGPNGIDISNAIRKQLPGIGLVFLSSFSSPKFAPNYEQMPIGSRFLTKGEMSDMQMLVNRILQAKKYPLIHDSSKRNDEIELTSQQVTLLKYLAEGLTTSEIASRLSISEKGVEANIARLQTILDVHKSSEKNLRVSLARAYFRLTGKINE
ncbi:MAG: DNA-binding response regulator [Actinobacteria bacterium]|nr:DNA-binding response regulator [Actinomycetota bacterium]